MTITSETNLNDWHWLWTEWNKISFKHGMQDASRIMLNDFGIITETTRCMWLRRTFKISDMSRFMMKKMSR